MHQMMHERLITQNYHKHVHACSCDFFLMCNRLKYAITIFMADKHAISNLPHKNQRSPTHHRKYVTSGEKFVTSGKIVRDIRTHTLQHNSYKFDCQIELKYLNE